MVRNDSLRIAGITIAVRCDDDRIRWRWDEPLSRFVGGDARPDCELSVAVMDGEPPRGGEIMFESESVWRMLRDDSGYRIECQSAVFGAEPYKIAIFDETFSRGTILINPAVLPLELNPLDYPLDEVLVANLLGRGRGVELHSCGIIDGDGRGLLFVGVSGAGKTTTARLWGERASGIVSDDRVIVRECDGRMWMFGTPWHGEAELSLPGGAPLAGVYLLVQASENAIRPIERAAAVARLFRCAFPPFHDPAAIDFTLGFLDRLAALVPVRDLHFIHDRSVVDLVLREAA